ncbi:bifunctional cobalt-precorrin-7 (C(5))-methyltransferase/cobalt-precorrin-6B (C(15))-methyltransferase [Pseudoroseomonas rhizosphaerae]|uniref:Bifunctional cobalt-precorrin-7 (C(5))-methyltransferase/cobalt-precorrin-6B (C(15))-methyltransferase n=2 Tax=Teichococcus rhizosphaerae TaxID=1335062 RepID=A0A2C7A9H0_9PROT|nr:bifunctional cobalt-precorrin-7 (C(5))-methyltransferase/cobalt-precorrin-6B (C(15))-methyltransferase [Pseudoroseomonas rhizosphaerae]
MNSTPWLSIIGLGEDGVEGLPAAARALLEGAEAVFGGQRHLALAAGHIRGSAHPWPSPMLAGLPTLLARRGRPTAVLASGDPFCFGIGATLARHVPPEEFLCLPAPSAFALACARLGWAMQDCATLSFCGRPLERLVPLLQPGARILALSADAETPAQVAALLRGLGLGPTRMAVLEAMGGPRERRHDTTAAGFAHAPDPLNMLALEVVPGPGARVLPLAPGLPEDAFEQDGQITKREVRAVTLAMLAPRQGELLWDIGCGSGSVAIEWMLRHPANRAIGLEPRPERAAQAARNALALGVPGLRLVRQAAPDGLAGLPAPDAVFVGGGGARPGVLEAAWEALRPGGRLVANAVTLETEAVLYAAQDRWGGALARLGVERLDRVGAMRAFRPAMTVTQYAAEKPMAGSGETLSPQRWGPGEAAPPLAVAGLGARPGVSASAVVALVREAEQRSGLRVGALAAPWFRRDVAALTEAAATLGLPLHWVEEEALSAAQPRCPTPSETARRATGYAAIAEGCALALGGRLALPRIAGEGVTCALSVEE